MDFVLNILSNIILSKYYGDSVCIFVITDPYNDFYYNGKIPTVNLKVNDNVFHPDNFRRSYGCLGFLLKSNTPCELFYNIEKMIRYSDERFNERQYLILPGDDYDETKIMCMFDLEEIEYVDDILIVIPKQIKIVTHDEYSNQTIEYKQFFLETPNITAFDLITHKYIGDIHNETVLLDKWFSSNKSFIYNNNLYPDKITNQKGRALRVTTFTYPPYAIPSRFCLFLKRKLLKSGLIIGVLDGTEVRVTNLYAEIHNMTIEMVVDEADQWGTIYDNWTGIGIVGNVATDKGDVGLGLKS